MKIRDIYVEVRLKADKALRDLRLLDRLTKSAAKSFTDLAHVANDMGKRIQAGANQATDGLSRVRNAGKEAGSTISSLGGLASTAFRAVGGAVIDAVQKSIDFESSMAQISKVVDGLRSPTGEATDEFERMKESIFDLSKKIAIAPKGFADIISAAGQAGIAKEELQGFAEDAAKMAVAFDVSADDAGNAMAKLRTGLGLTQKEVVNLAGTMNHLSNNMASAAPELVDVAQRVAAMGASAGLSGQQISGLASAMIASGAKTNVAATGIKNFTLALAAGNAATQRQKTGYEKLGLTAEEVAAQFGKGGKDSEEAMRKVLSSLKNLDQAERTSTIMQIFGRESLGAIAPLVTQIDNFEKAMALAADETAAAGSIQAEYDVRAKTTANSIQLLQNRLEIAAIKIGDLFLPALHDLLNLLNSSEAQAIGDTIFEFLEEVVSKAPQVFAEIRSKVEPIITSIVSVVQGFASGASESFGKMMEAVGPIFSKLTELAYDLLEALGLTGDEGAEFGKSIGEDVGGVALTAIHALSSGLDGVISVIKTLSPLIKTLSTIFKTTLGAAIGVVTALLQSLEDRWTTLTEAFESFSSGRIADGFAALGRAILDSLLTPIRVVAGALIDLADGIPGGSQLVPDVLRNFARKTGGGAGEIEGPRLGTSEEDHFISGTGATASRSAMQPGTRVSPRGKPAVPPEEETPRGGGGMGGGGGRGGKRGRTKQENLLDKAVEEAKKNRETLVLGTDRMANQAGPAVTNIYNTFNMQIDARGNEGVAANVERGAKRGAMAGIDKMRGLGSASMRAKAGGGAAAGAG